MDLTQGNITKQLIRFSLPIILSTVASVAISISDNIIVATCLGQNALATISSISSIVALAYILINGFASAITIVASKAFTDESKNTIYNQSRFLGIISSIVLFVVFVFGSSIFTKMLSVPESIIVDATACLRVYGVSFVFAMLNNIYTSLFQGFNDSKTPTIINLTTNGLNIVLDLFFMGVLDLPVISATYASMLALMIGTIIFTVVYHHNYATHNKKVILSEIKSLVVLSFSMMLQQGVMSICSMLISIQINRLGIYAININTACENLHNLLILTFIGLTNAFSIFLGTNLAANKKDRMLEGTKSLVKIGIVCYIFIAIIGYCIYPYLLKLYIQDYNPYIGDFTNAYRFASIISLFAFFLKYMVDAFFKVYENMKQFVLSSCINIMSRVLIVTLLISSIELYALPIALVSSILISMAFNLILFFKQYLPLIEEREHAPSLKIPLGKS